MQQDQRASGSLSLVVEVDAVDLGVLAAALDVGRPIGLHACAPCVVNGNSCRKSRLGLWLDFIGSLSQPRGNLRWQCEIADRMGRLGGQARDTPAPATFIIKPRGGLAASP